MCPSSPERNWCLVRLDDNGNEFVVCGDLSRAEAEALAREFEARGHKQSYWLRAQQPSGPDERRKDR
ncbi:hypothetical protein HP532_03615 [Pseudomonas sp. CrR25]|nr:hypothetical protein [Pseudomonas sp. CrR25]